ncbi:hypothetical protein QBC46DRAFT_158781 [Diplogelasinospora grovesii]|uniref:Serine-rich protein n=1 Tax=Diplogelasinospora grovesii TaxID=303347 RepID=A0AAN6NGH7_9PEZI|nr:hypothetical protein QBC46DRAFT_158781 [Diplogelasinospora grovesii]
MSAPSNRHGPTTTSTPLHQRTQSQNNTLAIRIVPYTPPRLDPEESRAASQASSHAYASRHSSGIYGDPKRSSSNAGEVGQSSRHWEGREGKEGKERIEGHASRPGPALSSPSDLSLRLVKTRDEGVSGSRLGSDANPSGAEHGRPTAPALRSPSEVSTNIAANYASTLQQGHVHHGESPTLPSGSTAFGASRTGAVSPRPLSRRRNFIALHSDNKTFSLVQPRGRQQSDVSNSLTSPPLSYSSRASGSHGQPSIDAWSDDRPSYGTSTTIPDNSFSEGAPFTPSPASSTTQLIEDPITSSPWNYRMVGGLRKVPQTPDLKQKKTVRETTSLPPPISVSETPLSPLPEFDVYREDDDNSDDHFSRTVVPKASFASAASAQTVSTTSENTNYKVYGHSSPAYPVYESSDSLGLPPSSSHSNYELLGESSLIAPPFSSSPPGTSDSNDNYVLHGDPSPSPSSLAPLPRKPRPTYSQESLRVPPLRPVKKQSYEKFGYYKQRSRENLRARAGSLQSLKSISSVISSGQAAAQAFLAAPVLINFGPTSSTQQQQFPWSTPQAQEASTGPSSSTPKHRIQRKPVPMIPAHPHQWSSQLSTVMSESEVGSERIPSRSVSPPSTGGNGNNHRRRSSTGWASSSHSRQLQSLQSISSSLAAQLEEAASGSDSIERPQRTYSSRGAGPSQIRLVRDQDEHGDGLTDLQQQPSRSGLSAFFASSSSSDRGLHSSASSRANSLRANSLRSSIPTWAKVYYGSGERRFLGGAPSVSTPSEAGSRPPSSVFQGGSESPNLDHFPLNIHSPRKRAKEVRPHPSERPFSDSASLDIMPAGPSHQDHYSAFRSLKRKTSSIWSPHLRLDRRASRYSVWDPPSVSWSADSGILGKRNAQVVLFIVGFIIPFAWMIAALLPLPPNPKLQMMERGADNSESQFGRTRQTDLRYEPRLVDETRYESARWWRNLNRIMSFVGLLIIGAVVALVVVGVKEGWMVRSS